MEWLYRQKVAKYAQDIVKLARGHQTPYSKVIKILTAVAVNAMDEERKVWESALKQRGIGPKTREKILKAVNGEEEGKHDVC